MEWFQNESVRHMTRNRESFSAMCLWQKVLARDFRHGAE